MLIYNSRLGALGVENFCQYALQQTSRAGCLYVLIMMDIVRNQGDSPADIVERATGDRGNSSAETIIRKLAEWGLVKIDELSGRDRIGTSARRAVYLTKNGADLLNLSVRS